jgi:predicted nicotinamide N-methyase
MGLAGHADLIEDTVALPGRELSLVRPRSSEALLDEEAFGANEFMPYWAELWPSASALARFVAPRALRGARTLELGCGLGLVSVTATLAGARVAASDWSPESVEFTLANAERNGVAVEGLVCSWAEPAALVERAPWQLVLGSDLLYESRNADLLLELLPRLVDERGEVWIADPGRSTAEPFFEAIRRRWDVRTSADPQLPRVTIHRLRLRSSSRREWPRKQSEEDRWRRS